MFRCEIIDPHFWKYITNWPKQIFLSDIGMCLGDKNTLFEYSFTSSN